MSIQLRIVQSVDPDLAVGSLFTVPVEGGVLGRAVDAAVVLAGTTVSRCHARLERRTGDWWLEPLTQTNAVMVDGAPIQGPTAVPLGVPFQLGGIVCQLVEDAGTSPVLVSLTEPLLLEVHQDGGACTVFSRGQLLEVPPASARVLGLLVEGAGVPVHRWDLLEALGESANLDKHVSLLRRALREAMEQGTLDPAAVARALELSDADPAALSRALIVTRRGLGYLLALPARQVRLHRV